ncbi:prolyl oligopeptidase family serine peptidase [Nocardiopsis ansamitocini]|uniref:prolyl oligopeptidase n=1 Tax=Nocardiopsis ansamitocini TaxID=1670832 RepID=A0A9W6P8E6_9ACTN|nr:prolyl oligopeptidase family serine peptidase [Nocardiopsis ansamitocini]GLU48906.1 prolyl endopeptidase [Nocardiopsis ansamitocini]
MRADQEARLDSESFTQTLHGHRVVDPYQGLEQDESPETKRWLADRDAELRAAATQWPLRADLADDIRGLVSGVLWSVPQTRGTAVFATRRDAGDEHPRLVVVEGDHERVLFDPLAVDPSGATTLDAWEPSPDGALVAVQTSSGGTERGALEVLSATDGNPVERPVPGVRYSHVAWLPAEHGPAFYFARRDDGDGRRGVWLHRIGAARGTDTLVHACTGPRTVPGVRLRRGRWLLISESHGTGHRSDLWIADLSGEDPGAPALRPVHVGLEAESEADVGPDGLLYLRTTHGAPLRRVCVTTPERPDTGNWREVVPEDPEATLDGFAVTGRPGSVEVLVTRTRLGISELASHDPERGTERAVELPGEGMVAELAADSRGGAHFCYADVSSQLSVWVYRSGEPPIRWPADLASAPDRTPVRRSVLWCSSADGTRVPVSVFSLDGASAGPTILHGYGGFGRPRQFGFSATVLAWLRAGGRYAVAHVRGGGDRGRAWHLAGAGRNKARAVMDLVAAADTLVARGMCDRDQLCLSGGSAGGLLVLAATARRPDLCAAVIASAPLADMVRFERLGLGAMWIREFGTAADPEDFAALLDYSPYHRVLRGGPTRYPAVLLTGFGGDTRTGAAHPRKMCAALLAAATGPRPILLRYEHGVGHGPRSVTRAIELAADAHAFAAAETGLSPARRRRARPHNER